jgi:hypothetical protein
MSCESDWLAVLECVRRCLKGDAKVPGASTGDTGGEYDILETGSEHSWWNVEQERCPRGRTGKVPRARDQTSDSNSANSPPAQPVSSANTTPVALSPSVPLCQSLG